MKKGLKILKSIAFIGAVVGFLGYWIIGSSLGYYLLGVTWILWGLYILLNRLSWIKPSYLKITIPTLVGLFLMVHGLTGLLGFHDFTQGVWEKSFFWKMWYASACSVFGILFLIALIGWIKKRKKR